MRTSIHLRGPPFVRTSDCEDLRACEEVTPARLASPTLHACNEQRGMHAQGLPRVGDSIQSLCARLGGHPLSMDCSLPSLPDSTAISLSTSNPVARVRVSLSLSGMLVRATCSTATSIKSPLDLTHRDHPKRAPFREVLTSRTSLPQTKEVLNTSRSLYPARRRAYNLGGTPTLVTCL